MTFPAGCEYLLMPRIFFSPFQGPSCANGAVPLFPKTNKELIEMAVRRLVDKPQNDDIHYVELACKSTDTKPKGFATGSLCLEVDTGHLYAYDETSTGTWTKIAELIDSGE